MMALQHVQRIHQPQFEERRNLGLTEFVVDDREGNDCFPDKGGCLPQLPIHPPQFDNFEIGRCLGSGSFCDVREVFLFGHTSSNYQVSEDVESSSTERESMYAIKTLRGDLNGDEESLAMHDLKSEASILSKLVHPNIISMKGTHSGCTYAFNHEEKEFSIVLEKIYCTLDEKLIEWNAEKPSHSNVLNLSFLKRKSDRHAVKKKDLNLRIHQVQAALDIACGLQYLHEHNIMHRDLKPKNIGFGSDGKAKLLDFGLSTELDVANRVDEDEDLYELTCCAGSVRYMAPEVYQSKPYNQSADTYSFGLLLWAIMHLMPPFLGISGNKFEEEVMLKGKRPDVRITCQPSLATLMAKCWSVNMKERPDFYYICNGLSMELGKQGQKMDGWRSSLTDVNCQKAAVSSYPFNNNFSRARVLKKSLSRRSSLWM